MHYQIINEFEGRMRIRLFLPDRPPVERREVEARFESLSGVKRVSFSPRTKSLLVHYEGGAPVRAAVLEKVQSAPFPKAVRAGKPTDFELKKKAVARSGTMLLMGPIIPPAVKPFLALYGALPIFRKGAASLVDKRINTDVLDSTAIGVSIASRDFLTASVISFLLKLGELLEEWTRRRFRKQLSAMFRTGDEWAWVVREEREARVKLDDIKVGETVIVRMGSLIPVDGVILSGEALVNQASLTGESLPVMKREGKMVYAGTAVEEGLIQVEAQKIGRETRAARVVKVIEEAEGLKAETQSHGERLADRVVPYSFLLSALTYALTGNANRAAAVLLVDYSCAIKLSTPLAILAGLARAAKENVLIKGGRSLEKLSLADAFILDKTGTLTEATPRVVEVVAFGGYSEEYVLRQAACVEEHFPHPVASAVVRHAAERGLLHDEEHEEVEYVLAHGIVSMVHGNRIMVGSRHFIHEDELVDMSETDPVVGLLAEKGYSVLYVAMGDKPAGLIAVHDPLRDDAPGFVERLRGEGIEKIVMLTGDNEPTARTVARKLGISDFYAQAYPETKVEVVKGLQKEGRVVAMVGDGINDSPALSHADVGISMKHGADIAREACDVLLMEGSLEDILEARRISSETLELIRSNYRTIIAINSLAILMAMTGGMPPILSAMMHNLSTIGVSLKALGPLRNGAKVSHFLTMRP
jgi:heavy metal translocating P-type ATPase